MRRISLLIPLLSIGIMLVPVRAITVELEVAELVDAIRRSIADAQKTGKPPTMKIPWIEAEVSYVVKKEGSAGRLQPR
jgi:hypothetical protein